MSVPSINYKLSNFGSICGHSLNLLSCFPTTRALAYLASACVALGDVKGDENAVRQIYRISPSACNKDTLELEHYRESEPRSLRELLKIVELRDAES
jgi:hypothetical protein